MKLALHKLAVLVNGLILLSMVAVGAYGIAEAQAQELERVNLRAVTDADFHCLQQNVYWEARNQSTLGQVAVAWVTLNRMDDRRWPSTICDVVWQRRQFSWTHDGLGDEPNLSDTLEAQAWRDAGIVADVVLIEWARGKTGPLEGAVMFHADYSKPSWRHSFNRVTQVDNHIFYN